VGRLVEGRLNGVVEWAVASVRCQMVVSGIAGAGEVV